MFPLPVFVCHLMTEMLGQRLGSRRTTSTITGTPLFMAPEMMGNEEYSYAVDGELRASSFAISMHLLI